MKYRYDGLCVVSESGPGLTIATVVVCAKNMLPQHIICTLGCCGSPGGIHGWCYAGQRKGEGLYNVTCICMNITYRYLLLLDQELYTYNLILHQYAGSYLWFVHSVCRFFDFKVYLHFRSKADAKEILKSSGASCDEIPSGDCPMALLLTWHQKNEMPGCFLTGTWIEGF